MRRRIRQGGIRMPFIARWPGKIASGKIDNTSLISAVDLLPTFCEIAGVKLPDSYSPDGISQVAALLGTAAPIRDKPLFWKMQSSWPPRQNAPYHWVSYAIVDQHWKLLANEDLSHVELYDIAADPMEQSDLAETRAEVVNQLREKITQWKASLPEKPTGDVFSEERKALAK